MGEMKHSVAATTDMVLCVFKRDDLWNMFRAQPGRAYDLTWIAAVEEHFLGQTITTLGQRDAAQRIAWAFPRIEKRLIAVGLGSRNTKGSSVPLPFRQQDLADALGMSLVHTNKTLGRLRDKQIAHGRTGNCTSWTVRHWPGSRWPNPTPRKSAPSCKVRITRRAVSGCPETVPC